MDDQPLQERRRLRQELRARRRTLSPLAQHRAAQAVALRLLRLAPVRRARRIALYLARDGEISPGLFAALAHARGKQIFLPVLRHFPAAHLVFARWRPHARLRHNRFGIGEPAGGQRQKAAALDLILLPLVGFDAAGRRLGMGGGFYDRTLAFKKQRPALPPKLLGLAHSCQELQSLTAAPWDIPLQGIVTERHYHAARRR